MVDPRFASSLSNQRHAQAAEREALRDLEQGLGGAQPDILCLFVTHHYGTALEKLSERLAAATGSRCVLGCTAEAVIGPEREAEREPGLALWAGVLPNTHLESFRLEPMERGQESIRGLPILTQPEQSALLLLADPFSFAPERLFTELAERHPRVPVIGGMSSGGQGPEQNLLYHGGESLFGGAVGVVIAGQTEMLPVVSQGCRPVGRPLVVTEVVDNRIKKLGGKQALSVLMEILQNLPEVERELFQHAPFIGLAVDASKAQFERGDFLARGLIGVVQEEGSIAIADQPRRGQTVQFLVRDAHSASEDLAMLLKAGGARGAAGALLFSCNGRGTHLFPTRDHDISHLRQAGLPPAAAAGFFAMGEIGPVGGRNCLHGFTASIALFRERGASS